LALTPWPQFSALNMKSKFEIIYGTFRVEIPPGKKRRYNEIYKAANDEGTIQAWDARKLFSRPEHHTTMNLFRALRIAGFKIEDIK